ncbi:hypothetical protein JTB14_032907 [Gonioctena quinquepunctata]|nr:hypothetical protein JTB14_032907 [Gonioctena quinquepunctata]
MLREMLVVTIFAVFFYFVFNYEIWSDEQIRAFQEEYAQRNAEFMEALMFLFRYWIRVFEEILSLPARITNVVNNSHEASNEVWEAFWLPLEMDIED